MSSTNVDFTRPPHTPLYFNLSGEKWDGDHGRPSRGPRLMDDEVELEKCAWCEREMERGYIVMDRGPFCGLGCSIAGTRDLITDEDRERAAELRKALGL